ncbi:MAG: DEAD/DEAH box helicase [Collinsella sp.]
MRELAKQFTQRGYESEAIDGSDSDAERDEVIRKLESGELEYIFSVNILNEGVDIPAVNQIIMLRRTESSIVFVQQLGRGLRKADNKESTLVLDFIGNYQRNFLIPVALIRAIRPYKSRIVCARS